jgi:hypothetical protein
MYKMIDYEKVDKLVENCKNYIQIYLIMFYGCSLVIFIFMKQKTKMIMKMKKLNKNARKLKKKL